jgi:hypothetical protein
MALRSGHFLLGDADIMRDVVAGREDLGVVLGFVDVEVAHHGCLPDGAPAAARFGGPWPPDARCAGAKLFVGLVRALQRLDLLLLRKVRKNPVLYLAVRLEPVPEALDTVPAPEVHLQGQAI